MRSNLKFRKTRNAYNKFEILIFKSTIIEFPRSCSIETKQSISMQHRTNTHLPNHRDVARAYFRLIDGKKKRRERERRKRLKQKIEKKREGKEERNAVKRVARRVEQCVINVKREPRANRFERVSLLRTRSPRPLAIFLLFRIQAESKVVLRPSFCSTPESSGPNRAILKIDVSCKWRRTGFLHLCPLIDHPSFAYQQSNTLEGQSSHFVKVLSKLIYLFFFFLEQVLQVLFINVFTYLLCLFSHREFYKFLNNVSQ